MEDMLVDHKEMQSHPSTLQKEHLEALAELVTGDVSMLIRFSPANSSELLPQKYQLDESRYEDSMITSLGDRGILTNRFPL